VFRGEFGGPDCVDAGSGAGEDVDGAFVMGGGEGDAQVVIHVAVEGCCVGVQG